MVLFQDLYLEFSRDVFMCRTTFWTDWDPEPFGPWSAGLRESEKTRSAKPSIAFWGILSGIYLDLFDTIRQGV